MVIAHFLIGFILASLCGAAHAQVSLTPAQAKLELVLDAREHPPLQREMMLATLRGTYSVDIALEKIVMPRMRDVEWIQLDHDNWRAATVDGRAVRTMERRLAFFPLRDGDVSIKPVIQRLTILDRASGQRSEATVSTEPVALTVQKPQAVDGDWWLPARAMEVTDEWSKDPAQLADGDSVVRTVTLTALGTTEQMIPPQPRMREPWLITFIDAERRGTALTPAGPLTKVTWRWTLRPITGEPGVIPQVVIPWFDTEARQPRTATLKAQPFGYAGFGANTEMRWQTGFSGKGAAAIAFFLGLVVPIVLLSPRGRVRSASELAASLRRLLPSHNLLELRRAARAGDAYATRKAVHALAAAAPNAVRTKLEPELLAIDRSLFGPAGRPPELAAFARQIEKLLRE